MADHKMSRREFLTPGFFQVARDNFFEGVLAMPILVMMGMNYHERKQYAHAQTQGLTERVSSSDIQSVAQAAGRFHTALRDLYEEYEAHFYVCEREEMECKDPDTGETYDCEGPEECDWVTPSWIPQEDTVETWRNSQLGAVDRLDYISNSAGLVLEERVEDVTVGRRELNSALQASASVATYGGLFAFAVFYEEIWAKVKPRLGLGPAKLSTPGRISRRHWIKRGAIAAANYVAFRLMGYTDQKLEERREELQTNVDNLPSLTDLTGEGAFQAYFGSTRDNMVASAGNKAERLRIRNTGLSGFLNTITVPGSVRRALDHAADMGDRYANELGALQFDEELTEILRRANITAKIEGWNTSQHLRRWGDFAAEAGAVAATLGVVVTLGEMANSQLP